MDNIKSSVKGNILTLEIDLSKKGSPSASGKTIVIASSRGNKEVNGAEGIYLGVNCYKYAEPKK